VKNSYELPGAYARGLNCKEKKGFSHIYFAKAVICFISYISPDIKNRAIHFSHRLNPFDNNNPFFLPLFWTGISPSNFLAGMFSTY
jgi:hypothetical protein